MRATLHHPAAWGPGKKHNAMKIQDFGRPNFYPPHEYGGFAEAYSPEKLPFPIRPGREYRVKDGKYAFMVFLDSGVLYMYSPDGRRPEPPYMYIPRKEYVLLKASRKYLSAKHLRRLEAFEKQESLRRYERAAKIHQIKICKI